MTTIEQTQKLALVTGASRGIGRQIALRLAATGAVVAVHYGRDALAAAATVDGIEAQGGRAFAVRTELGEHGDGERLLRALDAALEQHGLDAALHTLVLNAGIAGSSSLHDTDDAWLDRLFAVNAKAPFRILRDLGPRIVDGGRVVTLSTGLTRVADPSLVGYAMTKAAIDVMTLHLAQDFGRRGVTVNAVAPGVIDTDMNAGWLHAGEDVRARVAATSPFDRIGEAADVADVVAWLASPGARWVTGQVIDATGGARG